MNNNEFNSEKFIKQYEKDLVKDKRKQEELEHKLHDFANYLRRLKGEEEVSFEEDVKKK